MKFFEWQLVRCRACCKFQGCVGQVDAEKLAQRSSVAVGLAASGCGINTPGMAQKISSKIAFSKTLFQSAFPAKNSLVALNVDVVETG